MSGSGIDSRTEVLVVGGGPAGLATAIAARLEGFDVELVDRRRPPLDKACGEGLMPDGVARLREMGLAVDDRLGLPFRGIRYLDGGVCIEGRFRGPPGLGIRRTRLHDRLARRAEGLGVRLRWGVRALGLQRGRLDTDAGPIRARFVVGADGLSSRLRRWAGWDGAPSPTRRYGISRHYTIEPWSDLVEVHWADRVEAYVTPLGRRELGVTLLCAGDGRGYDELLAAFPRLAERLQGAPRCSRDRGAGPLHRSARRVHNEWLALVGDAAGYLDAISGEGLALAFHHAFALAAAMRSDDLARYGAAHRRLARVPETVTRALLFVERHPRLRRHLLQALRLTPGVFSRCLALLARQARPLSPSGRRIGYGSRERIARARARLPRASV